MSRGIAKVYVDPPPGDDPLQVASCDIVLTSGYVIKGIRLIKLDTGRFIAKMPRADVETCCDECGKSIALRDKFCKHCGSPQAFQEAGRDGKGFKVLTQDVAFPLHAGIAFEMTARLRNEYFRQSQRWPQSKRCCSSCTDKKDEDPTRPESWLAEMRREIPGMLDRALQLYGE